MAHSLLDSLSISLINVSEWRVLHRLNWSSLHFSSWFHRRSLCSLCVSHSHQTSSASCSSPSNGCSSPPARMSGYSTCGIQVGRHRPSPIWLSMSIVLGVRPLTHYSWLNFREHIGKNDFVKAMLYHVTESCTIWLRLPLTNENLSHVYLLVLPETQLTVFLFDFKLSQFVPHEMLCQKFC